MERTSNHKMTLRGLILFTGIGAVVFVIWLVGVLRTPQHAPPSQQSLPQVAASLPLTQPTEKEAEAIDLDELQKTESELDTQKEIASLREEVAALRTQTTIAKPTPSSSEWIRVTKSGISTLFPPGVTESASPPPGNTHLTLVTASTEATSDGGTEIGLMYGRYGNGYPTIGSALDEAIRECKKDTRVTDYRDSTITIQMSSGEARNVTADFQLDGVQWTLNIFLCGIDREIWVIYVSGAVDVAQQKISKVLGSITGVEEKAANREPNMAIAQSDPVQERYYPAPPAAVVPRPLPPRFYPAPTPSKYNENDEVMDELRRQQRDQMMRDFQNRTRQPIPFRR